MDVPTKRFHDLMRSQTIAWIGLAGSVASIISIVAWAYSTLPQGWAGLLLLSILAMCLLIVVAAATLYSVRVRQENRALRRSLEVLREINSNYRDVLSSVFGEMAMIRSRGQVS
jgi:protein-S-isoprenylcysteine O-methyltransferase Ste14